MPSPRKPPTKETFLEKFGESFLGSVPTVPGVYFVYNSENELIYIGKAKNLRRRLGQYKNAKRRRKHAKMRSIVAEGARIEFEIHSSDLEACLAETRLIQKHRPKWNIAGAFYFLYPMVGILRSEDETAFCYTTQPELFPKFDFHGAFRSRHITQEAFFGLMDLLGYVGHRIRKPSRQTGDARHSYIVRFRQLPQGFDVDWARFFKGESKEAAEKLVLALVENAGARHAPKRIQEKLNLIRRFWRHEAAILRKAIARTSWPSYPVSQKDRDLLILHSKSALNQPSSSPPFRQRVDSTSPPRENRS